MEAIEDQKKTLIYLGLAFVVVTILTIAFSFFGKNDGGNSAATDGNDLLLTDVQEEQIETFAFGYMNSDPTFHQKKKVTVDELTDEQRKLISLMLINTYKTYQEGSLIASANGCKQLMISANEYNVLTGLYFGENRDILRRATTFNMNSIGNYGDTIFQYDANSNRFIISGNYLCDLKSSINPASQYVIYNKDYQQNGNTVSFTIRYYYRKLDSKPTSTYTDYKYALNMDQRTLFRLTFENADGLYIEDLLKEENMIDKYKDQLYGLKFEFELLPNYYIRFSKVELVDPEVS